MSLQSFFHIVDALQLPNSVSSRLEHVHTQRYQSLSSDERVLVGQPGYTTPHSSVLFDAIVALTLGKHVLLKGPTGSGKTKLAETLSFLFSQPLHAVNCSVDLDAEALIGFKTLVHKEDRSSIEFIAGPVVKAMEHGQFLYIDEINMAKPETLPI